MKTRSLTILLAGVSILILAGCAAAPADPEERAEFDEANDPAEPTNRVIFEGNQFIDRTLLQPVTRAYLAHVPETAQHSIHNFVSNFGEPEVLINDLLQGNVTRAWVTTQRFAANSTIGLGGLLDPASDWGLPYHSADFGQTFGVWGVDTGPSVQLPLFAFSNVRDTAGLALGMLANPMGFIPGNTMMDLRIADSGVALVDRRAEVLPATDSLEASALDYYSTLRSVTATHRAALIEEGKVGAVSHAPRLGDDLGTQPQTRNDVPRDTASVAVTP